MSLVTGTKLGRYEIRSKIGAGGMGEVYLAEDSRLHRKVALKILPTELAVHKDRMRRFEQEATAAAALNHPNIAHVYEIGQHDDVNFIAMEFVDGETLRQIMQRGDTEFAKLLRYLQHAAEGLAKAHAAGIVHRDLKPENIMITGDGHAKVLDFGLAKLLEPQTASGSTGSEIATAIMPQQSISGIVLGTVGYMSPEQAQGKTKEIDQRSDVFSFGCILFEAATGKKPFEGESAIKSLHKTVYEPAPAITDFNPEAPADLQRIVRRCLAKDRDERFQTIKEAAIELKELRRLLHNASELVHPGSSTQAQSSARLSTEAGSASTSAAPSGLDSTLAGIKQHKLAIGLATLLLIISAVAIGFYVQARNSKSAINSIAVLPFENQSHDSNSDYLSDGITESLINSLSQLPNLKVMARTTVFRYRGRDNDAQTVGKDLGVAAILTGKILRQGDLLQIQADLVRVSDGSEIWGDKYTRNAADIFAVQSELAREISEKLELHLSGADRQRLTKSSTNNAEAYELYLKGYHSLYKFTDEGVAKSREYFQQAIDKDPNYAPAYAGLAEAYLDSTSTIEPAQASNNAKRAAEKAIALDSSLAEAHYALALVRFQYDLDWAAGDREFRQAIKLKPNYALAYDWYGFFLGMQGRFEEAQTQFKLGLEIDPLSLPLNADVATCYYWQRRYDEAIAQFNKTLEIDPDFPPALVFLATTYAVTGRYDKALETFGKLKSSTTTFGTKGLIGYVYARSGKRSEAERILAELKQNKAGPLGIDEVALIYTGLGDNDNAFEAWRATCRQIGTVQALKVDPLFDQLRSDPRFPDLVRCVGLTP